MAAPGRIRRVLPVFIILFLAPVIVILMFRFGRNEYRQLPYIGNSVARAPGDTIRHTIPYFLYTDQNGKPFGSDSLKGKIYIADFFFTSCPSICPKLTKNLIQVQERFRNDKDFRIVSFTLDPKRDNPETLKRYQEKNKITTTQWYFLTGPKDSIRRIMGQDGYLIVKPIENVDPDQLQHSEVMVLVDKEGHIRGTYNGLVPEEIERLIEDTHTLFVLDARAARK